MGELDTVREPDKRYDGFYDAKILYDGRRVFKSVASGHYYVEGKIDLEIMCMGDVDKMLEEVKMRNGNS